MSATFRCWLCGIHLTYLCDQKNAPHNLILQSALARKKLPNSKTLNGLIHTTDNAGGHILSSLNPMNLTKPITNPRKLVIKNFWHAANAPVSFQDAAYAKIPPSLCDRNALNDLLYSNLPHSLTQKDSQLQGTEQSHCHQRKMQIITQQTMQK